MSTTPKLLHGEAFCLMQYRSEDGTETETLWNSRDGVTPFYILSRSGKKMIHINWHEDKRQAPDFKPPSGMRVFVDATRELVTEELNKYVDAIWDDSEYPASKQWETKQACFEALLVDWLHGGEAPWIVTTP
jgi:hypothetical protein